MQWFRLYSGVLHDPKVQRLTPALFKHWINLLCLASEHDTRGELPGIQDIAFALRVKPSEAETIMAHLRRAGLIDQTPEGRDFPHSWPQRQRESDDVATRVRAHRERKAAQIAASHADGNTHVTLQKRPVDTDTDTDTEKKEIAVPDTIELPPDTDVAIATVEMPPTKPAKKTPARAFADDSPAMQLAHYFAARIQAANPYARIPANLDGWASEFDRCIRLDKAEPTAIRGVIDYAASDTFWRGVVLSGAAVRKHYPRLRMQLDEKEHKEQHHHERPHTPPQHATAARRSGSDELATITPIGAHAPRRGGTGGQAVAAADQARHGVWAHLVK